MTPKVYKKFFDLKKMVDRIKSYDPNFDAGKFLAAFEFADKAHTGQIRKDGKTPYIVHPVMATEILVKLHADEDILISTLLHDVPEDTIHTVEEVKGLFGEKVGFLVEGVTKLSKVKFQHNMPARQIESLKKMFLHSAEDPRVILIKLADRLHNMSTLFNIDKPEKRSRIARETLEIFVPIANLLGIQSLKLQLEDMCFMHLFPTEYETLKKRIDSQKGRQDKVMTEVLEKMRYELKKHGVKGRIYRREKNLYSIYKTLCTKGKSIEDCDDRISVRVVVPAIEDCYQTLGFIHKKFTPRNSRFKDYIANPKSNGYQSLHTAVFGPKGVMTEFQIRTEEMEIEDQYGITAHYFARKAPKVDDLHNDKRSLWMNKILEIEKEQCDNDVFLANLKGDILEERIFVFTPKGEMIDLPKGASALDFAYAIHTELGNHAFRAKINGHKKPISSVLKNGDHVQMLDHSDVHPDFSWFSFAKTNVARNKIKEFFKKSSKKQKIEDGKIILQRELDIAGLGICSDISLKKFPKFKTLKDLLEGVGGGTIEAHEIVSKLRKPKKARKIIRGSQFLTRYIYRSLVDGIAVQVKIVAQNKTGLVSELSEILYKHSLDMTYFKGWAATSLDRGYYISQIIVKDLKEVRIMFDEIKQLEGVQSVYRIYSNELLKYYFVATFTLALWVAHPFLLREFLLSDFYSEHAIVSQIGMYGSLLVLMGFLLYLTNGAKKYFPVIRSKFVFSIFGLFVPAAVFGALLLGVYYFQLELNSWIIFMEIMIFYLYMGSNYINFNKKF